MKKKVGNACRTKSQIRNSKSRGSGFEYDCQYSLSKIYPEIYRTSERGFQLQYDLECASAVFECKRLKGISWNQCVNLFDKLSTKTPSGKTPFLLFQSNRQPCLVFYWDEGYVIRSFESKFKELFEKHPSTRAKQ